MTSVKAHSALILAVVFALGILSGVGGTLVLSPYLHRPKMPPTPAQARQHFIHHMQTLLSLSPQQTTQFTAIVQETADRWDAVHQQIEPELEQIRVQQRDKVRAILNPDQVKKFNAFIARFDAMRKKGQHHHHVKRGALRLPAAGATAQIHRNVNKPVQNHQVERRICLKMGAPGLFAPTCSHPSSHALPI